MKAILVALMIAVFVAPARADQAAATADPAAAQFHRGTVKIRVGLAIAAAGVLAMPITAVTVNSDTSPNKAVAYGGLGAVAVGGAIALSGAQDQRRAARPQTAVGFSLGRVNGVHISRSW